MDDFILLSLLILFFFKTKGIHCMKLKLNKINMKKELEFFFIYNKVTHFFYY